MAYYLCQSCGNIVKDAALNDDKEYPNCPMCGGTTKITQKPKPKTVPVDRNKIYFMPSSVGGPAPSKRPKHV